MATKLEERRDDLVAEIKELLGEILDAVMDGEISVAEGFRIMRRITDLVVALPEPLESVSDLAISTAFDRLEATAGDGIGRLFRNEDRLRNRIKKARRAGRTRAVRRLRKVLRRLTGKDEDNDG